MQSESMRTQARSWWWTAAATIGTAGGVAALLTTPPGALLASVVVFAGVTVLVATGVQTGRPGHDPAPTADLRRLLDTTLLGTAGGVAALGLLQVSVELTAVVALALGGTAPWALSAGRGGARREPVRDRGTPLPVTEGAAAAGSVEAQEESQVEHLAVDLRTLPTPELVLAWRRSYAELLRVRTPSQLEALADRRQRLLDELERRDAPGVERWLRSGARAASDPSRFLQRPAGPTSAAA